MTAVTHRKVCARCGKALPADPQRRLFSAHTHNYFCADVDVCARRTKRAKAIA